MKPLLLAGAISALTACGALAAHGAPVSAPVPSSTTIVVTTTSSTTTTTTTTLPPLAFTPRCPNLIEPARAAGFPEADLERLDAIAHRESRCSITAEGEPRCAHNPDDPGTGPGKGSWGPWQTNQSWLTRNRWNPHPSGYLGALGIADSPQDLCDDWYVAARAAKALYDYSIATHGYEHRWYQWRT